MKQRIQVIAYDLKENEQSDVTFSTLSSPESLDEFDLNIIDLSSEDIWVNNGHGRDTVNCVNDFRSVRTMICSKKKSKILYVIPQNIIFKYDYGVYSIKGRNVKCYGKNNPLKDMLPDVENSIFSYIFPALKKPLYLVYENTRTEVDELMYKASFYFDSETGVLTKSICSEKPTTILLNSNIKDIYATTLEITNTVESLLTFLAWLFKGNERQEAPDWIKEVAFADDNEQHENINKYNIIIKDAKEKIQESEKVLADNERYKSILYTNGDDLVNVIFDILDQILDYNLTDFIDEKREDFLIKKPGCTFIGEIKGVSTNVKNEHIAQLEYNYHLYVDKLEENNEHENVKQILIINPLRKESLPKREPIHKDQIKLAERNGCLIIETVTMLWIFENFKKGLISTNECFQIFKNKSGVLSEKDFHLEG